MDSDFSFPRDKGIRFVTCIPSYLCILASQYSHIFPLCFLVDFCCQRQSMLF